MPSLENIRSILLITLSILLVAVLYRRFRLHVVAQHMPVRRHAELTGLLVAYHPARLRVEVKVPAEQAVRMVMLDADHRELHAWPAIELAAGGHTVELELPTDRTGTHFLELRTDTQRTVRQFIVRA